MEKQSARGIYWHGTSTKYLREILKKGLIPDPKELQYSKEYEGSSYSVKTYGGVYITNRLQIAFSYGRTAAKNTNKDILLIACTYETRSPSALLDEDLFLPSLEEATHLSSAATLFSQHSKNWGQLLDLDTYFPHLYPTDYLAAHKALKNINTKSPIFARMVEKFIEEISQENEKVQVRIEKNINKVVRQVENLILLYALHLLESYFVGQKEKLERLVGGMYFSDTSKDDAEKQEKVLKILPKLLGGSFTNLVRSVNEVTKTMKEISSEVQKGDPHNVRVQEPITYRGKNRILDLFYLKEDSNQSYTVDAAFGRDLRIYGQVKKYLIDLLRNSPIQFKNKGEVEVYYLPKGKPIPSHWDAVAEDFSKAGYYSP